MLIFLFYAILVFKTLNYKNIETLNTMNSELLEHKNIETLNFIFKFALEI